MANRILGLDSGVNGACALYCAVRRDPDLPLEGAFDLPTVGEGNRRELDYAQLRNMIWHLKPDVAFLEYVNAMPGFRKNVDTGDEERMPLGATSIGRMMGAFYAIKAVVACLDIPLYVKTSPQWKKHFSLRGGKDFKDDARLLAIQRYPQVAPFLKRKLDQHRADAWLIAVFGAHVMAREDNLVIPE